jgi:NAD(P)-dependent dehydrogenase (short-subunit alcohol dehydrogenase family)
LLVGEAIDLDGQVAVVTGAGRGIGRAHAVALAERGAAVVVNDVGTGIDGTGRDEGPAREVVDEIRGAGGRAIASGHDLADPTDGAGPVEVALGEFGRVDVLVHNAGIVVAGPFAELPVSEVRRVLDVHLLGAWHVGQPAWRAMVSQGYGRIVLTTSGAIFGHPMVAPYAAAKHGIIGLTKSLHQEAAMAGIDLKVNAVAPIGATRMARDAQKDRFGALLDPAAVAAVVTYLASPASRVSGAVFHAGAGHVCEIFLGQTWGWARGEPGVTPEEVAAHLDEALDETAFSVPADTNASTDLVYAAATGKTAALESDEILPAAAREAAR